MCLTFDCRSTNTSPGGPAQSGPGLRQAILARSASQALAAKAAASALKSQTSTQSSLDYRSALSPKDNGALTPHSSMQLTPVSAMTPAHATHTYTPGSFGHSPSLSREIDEAGAEDLEVAGVTLHCSSPLAQGKLMPPRDKHTQLALVPVVSINNLALLSVRIVEHSRLVSQTSTGLTAQKDWHRVYYNQSHSSGVLCVKLARCNEPTSVLIISTHLHDCSVAALMLRKLIGHVYMQTLKLQSQKSCL